MHTQKVSGIIVGNRPHKELDRAIRIFTREYGIMYPLAKGVRKITSQRGCHLDVLNYVSIELEQPSRSVMHYVREVTPREYFKVMKSDLQAFSIGCFISQCIVRILPDGTPHEEAFTCTLSALEALNQPGANTTQIATTFVLKIANMMGMIPPTVGTNSLDQAAWSALEAFDPQLTLTARRTLGSFSN